MFLTYPAGLGVPTFGNVATCSLQGFFTQFGYAAGSYNLVLSLYYFLIINKGMKKEEFARVWEKVLHGIIVICHLTFAIVGVSIGLFNPTPGFCYITPGPYGCKNDPNVTCRFETTAPYFYEAFAQAWIQLAYVVIIVTNLLIWLFVRRQEKEMDKYRTRSAAAEQLADMEKKSSYARSVFIQSILYIGAFVLTWSWSAISFVVAWTTGKSVPWITVLANMFIPLQGFFNAFIYARPRYIRLKKKNGHMGFRQLIKLVFLPDDGRGRSTVADQDRNSTLRNSSAGEVGSDRNVSKKDSNMFKSFLSSLNRKKKREASNPFVSVMEPKEKTITWSDKKPAQEADEEEGKVEEGEETNGDVSPEGSSNPAVEEEKSEEG